MKIINSNRIEKLTERCALLMSQDSEDLLKVKQIIVRNRTLGNYLKQSVAARNGICANVAVDDLWTFLWKLSGRIGSVNRGSKDFMTWTLYSMFSPLCKAPDTIQSELLKLLGCDTDKGMEHSFALLKNYLNTPSKRLGNRIFELSSRFAECFENYQLFRSQMLISWRRGEIKPEEFFMAKLYLALEKKICCDGNPFEDRNQLVEEIKKSLLEGTVSLPSEIYVFAISSLSKLEKEVLDAISQKVNVYFLNHTPTEDTAFLNPPPTEDTAVFNNPLLESFGVQAKALGMILGKKSDESLMDEGDESSMLKVLQKDLMTNQKVGDRLSIKDGDNSVQIRINYTPKRELEVLRDTILNLIKKDPTLTPRDFLVMIPDIEKYTSLINTVFGREEDNSAKKTKIDTFIPYQICDRFYGGVGRVSADFISLLKLGSRRIKVTDLMDLIDNSALAAKFSLVNDDADVIEEWIKTTCMHWGFDEDDVKVQIKMDKNEDLFFPWSLKNCYDRLIKGIVLGSESNTDGYEDISRADLGVLSRFGVLIEKLQELSDTLRSEEMNTQSAAQWEAFLNEVLDTFFEDNEHSASQIKRLREAIHSIYITASSAIGDFPVPLSVIISKLANDLDDQSMVSPKLDGKMIFSSIKQLSSVPCRYAFMLGLAEGVFPRQENKQSYDLMKDDFQIGDRSICVEDRYDFLKAILSAKDGIYLSYTGRSPNVDTPITPSLVVTEFIDYMMDRFELHKDKVDYEEKKGNRIIRFDRLNAYEKENFIEHNQPNEVYSGASFGRLIKENTKECEEFNPQNADLGVVLQKYAECTDDNPFLKPVPEHITVSIEQLSKFFDDPCASFLKEQFGITTNIEYGERPQDDEPFEFDHLSNGRLVEELVMSLLNDPDADMESLLSSLIKKGDLPQGAYIDAKKDQLIETARTITGAVTKADEGFEDYNGKPYSCTEEVTLLNGKKISVTFCGVLPEHCGSILSSYAKDMDTEPKYLLRAFLRKLAIFSIKGEQKDIVLIDKNAELCLRDKKIRDCSSDDLKNLLFLYVQSRFVLPVPISKENLKSTALPLQYDELKNSIAAKLLFGGMIKNAVLDKEKNSSTSSQPVQTPIPNDIGSQLRSFLLGIAPKKVL